VVDQVWEDIGKEEEFGKSEPRGASRVEVVEEQRVQESSVPPGQDTASVRHAATYTLTEEH